MTNYVVERPLFSVHVAPMLTKLELLAELEARGVKNAEMQRVLGLESSRVSEIRYATPGREPPPNKKPRELTYDEGVKLVQAFLPEPSRQADVPPLPMLRLAILHIARKLGAPATEAQVDDLAKDLRAFLRYASGQKALGSEQATTAFFDALVLRQESPEEEARPETDPEATH